MSAESGEGIHKSSQKQESERPNFERLDTPQYQSVLIELDHELAEREAQGKITAEERADQLRKAQDEVHKAHYTEGRRAFMEAVEKRLNELQAQHKISPQQRGELLLKAHTTDTASSQDVDLFLDLFLK